MKPFALSLSKGIGAGVVLRQAQHERYFTLTLGAPVRRPLRGVGPLCKTTGYGRATVAAFFVVMCALLSRPGLAEPTTFGTTIGPAVLCTNAIEPDFFHGYLNTHFGQPARQQGAWWWQATGTVYGTQVSEVFVSDSKGPWAGIGLISSVPPKRLAEALAAAPGGQFRERPDGTWHSTLGSVITDHSDATGGGRSRLFCLRQNLRYLAR